MYPNDTIEQHTQWIGGLAADSYGDTDHRPPLVLLHGLTFDRTMWRPALAELRRIDPGRRVLSVDLPGHGESPTQASYFLDDVVRLVHRAVEEAQLRSPVLVGHSAGAIAATVYAARYPTSGVVNVDQPLQTAPFAQLLRSQAQRLRGPDYLDVWQMFYASMHVELLPPDAQELLRTTCHPRQDLLLGYWSDILNDRPINELTDRINAELAVLRATDLPYHLVAGTDLDPDYRRLQQEMLPDATITVLPGSGHFPHLRHPQRFAACLEATGRWPDVPSSQPSP